MHSQWGRGLHTQRHTQSLNILAQVLKNVDCTLKQCSLLSKSLPFSVLSLVPFDILHTSVTLSLLRSCALSYQNNFTTNNCQGLWPTTKLWGLLLTPDIILCIFFHAVYTCRSNLSCLCRSMQTPLTHSDRRTQTPFKSTQEVPFQVYSP